MYINVKSHNKFNDTPILDLNKKNSVLTLRIYQSPKSQLNKHHF